MSTEPCVVKAGFVELYVPEALFFTGAGLLGCQPCYSCKDRTYVDSP